MNELRVEAPIDFAAKSADMGLHHAGLRIEMKLPDVFEQHGSRDDAACVPHEVFQKLEFLRLQVDAMPGPSNGSFQKIHLEIGHAQSLRDLSHRRPAGERVDPGEQLGKREWLDEIIIAARLQAFDPIVDPAERCQKQHGSFRPRRRGWS